MNCQPGDMAISVNCNNPVNLGIIVRVLRQHVNTPEWDYGDVPCWWCESTVPMTWYLRWQFREVRALEGPIPDRSLRPIHPPQSEQPVAEPEQALA